MTLQTVHSGCIAQEILWKLQMCKYSYALPA